jgi:16S rRNA (cytosine967-C5)-methyltransferase
VASGLAAVQDEASQLAALALTRTGVPARTSCGSTCARVPAARRGCWAAWPPNAARAWSPRISTRTGPAAPGRAGCAGARTALAAKRAGRESYGVIAADGRQAPWLPGTFDRVLADVPCSGLGSLRRRPEARWRKAPGDVAELASLQRQLLGTALDSVRPGGWWPT